MAKRMDRRLKEYRADWDRGFWPDGEPRYDGDLRELAASLPSLGGVEIGAFLERYASEVPKGQAIVEVGSWLGAGTAHLALGAVKSKAPIHVYDRFKAKAREVKRAAGFGVALTEGEDTMSRVMRSLRPFGADIAWHRCDIRKATWHGDPIGLYVDDASKLPKVWSRAAATFLPHIALGGVIVLMDYHFHEHADPVYIAQVRYMESQKDRFALIEDRLADTVAAAFRRVA